MPAFGGLRRERPALNDRLLDALDGRMFMAFRRSPARLSARFKLKSAGQGKLLMASFREANDARADTAESASNNAGLAPPPEGVVRIKLDEAAYDITLDGNDLLVATAGATVSPWPPQAPTQLRVEVAIGEYVLPEVPELDLIQPAKPEPAGPRLPEYRKIMEEAKSYAEKYAKVVTLARKLRQRQMRRMGIAGLSARQTGDHIDIALDQGRGLGFRQLLTAARWNELAGLYYEQYRFHRAHAEALERADELRLQPPPGSSIEVPEGGVLGMLGTLQAGAIEPAAKAEPSDADAAEAESAAAASPEREAGAPPAE